MPISPYRKLAYRIFKSYDNKPRPDILKLLYKADIQMLPAMYVGTIALTGIIATSVTVAATLIVFRFIISSSLWLYITLGMTAGALGMSLGALPLITLNRITAKQVKIEATLPFVLAYIATLASTGMNPVETIKHVALKDFGPVSTEFQKIVYREEVLGEDAISAISFVAASTPSESLKDILTGFTNIILSGGSLKAYCEQQSKNLFETKRSKLKGFIDSLASFAEGYVGGVIVGIVMGIIGIIIIGAFGFKFGFLSTQNLLDIFVFVIIPLINAVFIGMLEMKFSSGEF